MDFINQTMLFTKYFVLTFTSFFVICVVLNSALEFGSFNLIISNFTLCKGPKRKDCCNISSTITKYNQLEYDIIVNENVTPTKGKIIALTQGKETLRLQLKNPCNHLFMRPLLQSMLNVTDRCSILKGHYHFLVDIQEIALKYYGGDFIYGKWTFKSVFYNNQCNFSCSVIDVDMVPKNKTSGKPDKH